MGKIRRGGYVFVTWIGDHGNHVHVYRDYQCEEPGSKLASRKIKELIQELREEGELQYESKKSNRE